MTDLCQSCGSGGYSSGRCLGCGARILTVREQEQIDPLAPWRDQIESARRYDEAHPESPFIHLWDPETGRLVQFRRDEL